MRFSSLLLGLAFTATAHAFSIRPAMSHVGGRVALARQATVVALPLPAQQRARPPIAAETVIPEDYRLAGSFVVLGVLFFVAPWVFGGFFALLGSFLLFQTARIRFVFDDDAFEVKTKPLDSLFDDSPLTNTGDNFAVGGDNRWAYSSFVNYDFFPSEALPILVYFKETQTPADKWDVGPGQWANSDDALKCGAVKGQVHFFPCIASAQQLKENFVAKGCAKL